MRIVYNKLCVILFMCDYKFIGKDKVYIPRLIGSTAVQILQVTWVCFLFLLISQHKIFIPVASVDRSFYSCRDYFMYRFLLLFLFDVTLFEKLLMKLTGLNSELN